MMPRSHGLCRQASFQQPDVVHALIESAAERTMTAPISTTARVANSGPSLMSSPRAKPVSHRSEVRQYNRAKEEIDQETSDKQLGEQQ